MNNFQSMQSGQGLLKDVYDSDGDSPVERALRKRAQKLKEKTIEPTKDELEQSETEG
jgi:hypothetical protein